MITDEDKQFLALYSDSEYDKPSVTVDAVIFRLKDKHVDNYRKLPEKKLQVYLTKREYPPFKNKYGIVGTFIDLNNELSKTMQLCVANKVKLNNYYYEQLYTFGEKQRDPRTRVLSISYMLLTSEDEALENGEWFDVDLNLISAKKENKENGYEITNEYELVLSNENNSLTTKIFVQITKNKLIQEKNLLLIETDLAFDHAKIIYYALERLKNKLEYTDIIFNLLKDKFTLTELKYSYEVILGEKLLDANFRRKTAHMVQPLNEFSSDKGHRPSQLFKASVKNNKHNDID